MSERSSSRRSTTRSTSRWSATRSVLVMGEDVGKLGGVFRATAGLQERFGADRCVDTPLAEAGILGTAVGLCMAGWRPVCEMQYDAFSYPALDQLINHVGRYRWRTSGAMSFPIVVRMPYGGGVRAPELHDDSPETYYVHTPGREGRDPVDAGGREGAARRGDPRPRPGRRARAEARLPHARARRCRRASTSCRSERRASRAREPTLTIVAYGAMVPLARARRRGARGRGVVRGARPPDAEAARRGRHCSRRSRRRAAPSIVQEAPRVCGFAAEVAAVLAEKAIFDLRGPGRARHRATTSRTRTGRSRTRTCRRSSGSWTRRAGCSPPDDGLQLERSSSPTSARGSPRERSSRWLVSEGQHVREDDPLVEIQTDKATVEIPSPYEGTVLRILVAEGEIVSGRDGARRHRRAGRGSCRGSRSRRAGSDRDAAPAAPAPATPRECPRRRSCGRSRKSSASTSPA